MVSENLLLIILLYKFGGIFCGLLCIYWGYRLFMKGVFGNSGEINATFSNNTLLIKKAAPGTLFALFGAAIIISITWRQIGVDNLQNGFKFRYMQTMPDAAFDSVKINSN